MKPGAQKEKNGGGEENWGESDFSKLIFQKQLIIVCTDNISTGTHEAAVHTQYIDNGGQPVKQLLGISKVFSFTDLFNSQKKMVVSVPYKCCWLSVVISANQHGQHLEVQDLPQR